VDFNLTVVANEPQFSKFVHEETNPPTSCANHLCESLLADSWNCNFRLSVLAELSKQEKNTGKSFLAGIEKLVNQILFVAEVRVSK